MKVTVTEQEILNNPNDQDLGALVRQKYWSEKQPASVLDYVDGEYDKCVICGKTSPYKTTTHIDFREGYVDGAGQGCFQPNICNKEK